MQKLASELWGDANVPALAGSKTAPPEAQTPTEHRLGKGRVLWDRGPQAGNSGSVLGSAQWIWHKEGNPAASAPVGKRFFRRSVTLDEDAAVESARVYMTADNSFELWVNGQPAGSGENFHQVVEMDVGPLLKPGLNVLAVWAVNSGETPNPAGLIGNLAIRFRSGRLLEVPTDRQWQSPPDTEGASTARADAGEPWGPALELGPAGMAPWGLGAQAGREPAQYGDFSVPAAVLRELGLPPDFESSAPLRYAHRRATDADLYFVANREEKPVQADVLFRVAGKAPELWDPVTGETRALPDYRAKDGRTVVPLRFEPAQSCFVVFRKDATVPKDSAQNFPAKETVLELNGPWEVAFDPKWGGPESVTFDKLEDWSKRPEAGIRYYSGTAVYRTTFHWPPNSKPETRNSELGTRNSRTIPRSGLREEPRPGPAQRARPGRRLVRALGSGHDRPLAGSRQPSGNHGGKPLAEPPDRRPGAAGESAPDLDDLEPLHQGLAPAGVGPAGARDCPNGRNEAGKMKRLAPAGSKGSLRP